MSRRPKQFLDDLYEIGAVNVTKVSKRPKIDKNLYEVEIVVVNKERKQIKYISWITENSLMSGVTYKWLWKG